MSVNSFRICVFGSSSKHTKPLYVQESVRLGEEIAKRGYLCVNGAGHTGCMGGVNQGCQSQGGLIRGIIHEKFCVDFGEHPNIQDLIMCKGDDLSARKQALLDHGDCVIVLPGGVGTFDELWDAVCGKSLGMKGMTKKPIVLVNLDGFYDGFLMQLHRAHLDGILYGSVSSYIHVESNVLSALDWCVQELVNHSQGAIHDADVLMAGIKENNVDEDVSSDRVKLRNVQPLTALAESQHLLEYLLDVSFVVHPSLVTLAMGALLGAATMYACHL